MRAKTLLIVPAMLATVLVLAFATPGTARDHDDDIAVSIAGTLTGPGSVAKLGVNVQGTAEHLSGTGGSAHVALAAPATFAFSGSVDGSVVVLEGHVAHAAFESLVGTPVRLTADASTGMIDLTFGPIPGGPQAGTTLVLSGRGKVTVAGVRTTTLRSGA
jgi:hypothetical protein